MARVNLTDSMPRAVLLFKADRPRAIDRYIDYFGGSGPAVAEAVRPQPSPRDDRRVEPAP